MVISLLRLFPVREQRRQLLALLRSLQGPTQAQPHCRTCRLYEEDGADEALLYLEEWDSKQELERHVRSAAYRRLLEAMDLSRACPELSFHLVTETHGMELVQSLRGAVLPSASRCTPAPRCG